MVNSMGLQPGQEALVRKIAREEAERTIDTVQVSLLKGVFLTRDEFLDAMDRMDKRFEAVQVQMDKRFEAMDKRFEELIDSMNKRFEAVDNRFEELIDSMNKRFEAVDKRFEGVIREMKEIRVAVDSLGSRSGKALENTILELMKDQLLDNDVEYTSIEVETLVDEEGIVFHEGYSTDIDVVAKGDEVALFEVKYKADQRDFAHFLKNAELYEKLRGKKPAKLYVVCLEIASKTLRATCTLPVTVIAGSVTL